MRTVIPWVPFVNWHWLYSHGNIRGYRADSAILGHGSISISQSCSILCDPMDRRPPGTSVRGILQARVLEWVAVSFSLRSGRNYLNCQPSLTCKAESQC